MKTVGQFGGILYFKDIPVLKFKFKGGYPVEYELVGDKRFLPADFELNGYDLFRGLVSFFSDRCTPDTRIGIHETLAATPIKYYHVERMLRYNHAQCIHDCFWVEQDNDNSCWDGTELEGIGVKPNKDWNNIYTSKKFI